jgi:hypothetical protein
MKADQRGPFDDDLRPEYDLESLELRRVGPGRDISGTRVVRLEPDVVEMFPDSRAVNEALRFLIRAAKTKHPALG